MHPFLHLLREFGETLNRKLAATVTLALNDDVLQVREAGAAEVLRALHRSGLRVHIFLAWNVEVDGHGSLRLVRLRACLDRA